MDQHVSGDRATIGIIGFGAFGQLMARHLAPHFQILAHDPQTCSEPAPAGVEFVGLETAAAASIVVLAVPVHVLASTAVAVSPHLREGALVLDVGSVKVLPAALMAQVLPAHVDVLATHPLFGPQSARDGLRGSKIALCPVRGDKLPGVRRFLKQQLGLTVIVTTPEAHDRDAAIAQGLTHLVGKILDRMDSLPERLTTRSFDLIREAIGMVRHDAPGVTRAIEAANPFAAEIRQAFFAHARTVEAELSPASAMKDGNADVGRTGRQASG
jgi:prephenate dehydrogenase